MFDLNSLSKNKIIFFAILGVVVIGLLIGASMLSSSNKWPKTNTPKELSVWVVGDETAGFSDIITGFKNRYPEYKNMDVKFTKFGNYADYEKTLLAVLSDGHSPDIFVVNSNWGALLESKILGIPATVVNPDEFSKNFNKVFDDLIISTKETDDSGNEKTVSGLKGIPLGYQTLGIFYNWKLVRTVPHLWNDIINTSGSDNNTDSESSSEYTDILLGLDGKYIMNAPDIISALFLQNGVNSYTKLSEAGAKTALASYFSLAGDETVSNHLQGTMNDLNLSTVDMFVRGKVGMVIGFPSFLREIEYAIKRAGSENVISDKFLRTSALPQVSNDPGKSQNLADYNYFALSKTSANPEAGFTFLAYLASREAEEKYLAKFPLYLSAQRIFEEKQAGEPISKDYERVKYGSFASPDTELLTFDKGLKNEYDSYFASMLGSKKMEPRDLLMDAVKYIDCNKKHSIDFTALDEECKIGR